jgi:hypothetical protein
MATKTSVSDIILGIFWPLPVPQMNTLETPTDQKKLRKQNPSGPPRSVAIHGSTQVVFSLIPVGFSFFKNA